MRHGFEIFTTFAVIVAAWVIAQCLMATPPAPRGAVAESSQEQQSTGLAAQPLRHATARPVVVITGSSTVRLWKGAAASFPHAQVINTGFGGSTMDALLANYSWRIGRFAPDEVIISSGDNDLAEGRSPSQVLADTAAILDLIAKDRPGTAVALVAAKPSPRRWGLRARYEELNTGFRRLAEERPGAVFVDVWRALLTPKGRLRPELYRRDGLHLNAPGYRIYAHVIARDASPELHLRSRGAPAAARSALITMRLG